MDQISLSVIRRPHEPNLEFEWLAPHDTAPRDCRVSKVMVTPQKTRRSFGGGTTLVADHENAEVYYLTSTHALLFFDASARAGQIITWPFVIDRPVDFLAAIILPNGSVVWTWDESDPDNRGVDPVIKEALKDYLSVH